MISMVALASGRGSNFRAVVNALSSDKIKGARMIALITDRLDTGAAQFAREHSIDVYELDYKSFFSREAFNEELRKILSQLSPQLILTLGYMRILEKSLVAEYRGRIINIHPSLLPAFPGMHSQRQAFDYGVRIAGTTVHFIDEGVDTGPIIYQAAVEVTDDMDASSLADRILVEEHRILIRAVDDFCQGRLRIDGRRVFVSQS